MKNLHTIYLKTRTTLLDPIAFSISKNRLRRLMTSEKIEDVINSINLYSGKGFYDKIRLAQDYNELYELCKRIEERKPKVIAEIGTWNGGTLYVWTRINSQSKKIISIDLPDGRFGGGYDEKRIKFFREFSHSHPKTKMYFIRGDSKSEETQNKLETILESDKIDFLYIDGDHTYEGIKKDFQTYLQYMSCDSMIGFHDINTLKEEYGVNKFWNEIKNNYIYEEFIKPNSRIMGNGIIYLKT